MNSHKSRSRKRRLAHAAGLFRRYRAAEPGFPSAVEVLDALCLARWHCLTPLVKWFRSRGFKVT